MYLYLLYMRNRTGYASDRLSLFSIASEHNNIVSCVHYNITRSVCDVRRKFHSGRGLKINKCLDVDT